MRNVGHNSALGRVHRSVREEHLVKPELLHEPALLGARVIATACHRTCVANRSGELALPTAYDACDDRLGEVCVELVIASGFAVQHCSLAAGIVSERKRKLR